MVQGIIIPADNTAPLKTATLDSLEDYQRAVSGWIEAVDIPDLGVTMYVNEEGLIRDLPFNRRATFLWRCHVPQARDAGLVGDVAVVGLTDDEGESTELPTVLQQRLLEPGAYRVRTREHARGRWHEEPIDRFDYVETVDLGDAPAGDVTFDGGADRAHRRSEAREQSALTRAVVIIDDCRPFTSPRADLGPLELGAFKAVGV